MYAKLWSPPSQTYMGPDGGTQVSKPVEGVSTKKKTCFSLFFGEGPRQRRDLVQVSMGGVVIVVSKCRQITGIF